MEEKPWIEFTLHGVPGRWRYEWDADSALDMRRHTVTHYGPDGTLLPLRHPFHQETVLHDTADAALLVKNPTRCAITHAALHTMREHKRWNLANPQPEA